MTTHAGTGTSKDDDSRRAGLQAAEAALADLGGDADLVLLFATAGHDQEALLEGVRSVLGDAPLAGCTGEGVISKAGSDEGTHAVSVMAVASDRMTFHTLSARGLEQASDKAGLSLAQQVADLDPDDTARALLLFTDGLTVNSTTLLETLHAHLPTDLPVVGGLAGELMKLERTWQYHDDQAFSDGASAVLVRGDATVETGVSHGCTPMGLEREVTRAEANMVYEIDGKPAFDVFKEYVDDDPDELRPEDIVHMCLGERLPPDEAAGYSDYIIRTPLGLDADTGGLHFPVEIPEGTAVQMTRREPDRIRDEAGRLARDLKQRRGDRAPDLLLQFDCAGRGRILFGERTDPMAMAPIRDVFGGVPLVGFHTYGELAPLGGRPRFHNYTVALCAIYEGRDD